MAASSRLQIVVSRRYLLNTWTDWLQIWHMDSLECPVMLYSFWAISEKQDGRQMRFWKMQFLANVCFLRNFAKY